MALMAVGGGFQLNTPAGLAYLRARRDGCPAGINSATRSYEQQLDWYLNQGKKGYPAKADNPNRSKHVWRPNDPADKGARALDLPEGGPQEWMRKNGHKYGWMKDRVSGEKWHFEYEEWNDPSKGSTTAGDDFLSALTADEQRRLLAWADTGSARLEQVYNATVNMKAAIDTRLPKIHAGVDLTVAATNNITNGIVAALDRLQTLLNRESGDVDVDEEALAAALAPLITTAAVNLSDEDLNDVAQAVNNERDRRENARLDLSV